MTVCIPNLQGVPWAPIPPQWWSPDAADYSSRVDDTRWGGAYGYGYGDGGGPIALLRLGWTPSGGNAVLLSFDVRFDPAENASTGAADTLWVGISTANGELFFKIELHATGVFTAAPALQGTTSVWLVTAYRRNADGSTGNTVDQLANTPDWIARFARVWRQELSGMSANYPWTVQLRIPVNGGAASLDDDTGVRIDMSSFRMWVYGEKWIGTDIPVPFQWPQVLDGDGAPIAPYDSNGNLRPPSTSAWNVLSCAPGLCSGAGGVYITSDKIGTTNTNQHEIVRNAPNVFFAKPRNLGPTAIAADQIKGTIRLANWGSAIGAASKWPALPVMVTGEKDTNHGTIPNDGSVPSDAADIRFTWNSSVWEADIVAGIRDNHQCMVVELAANNSGTTPITFTQSIAWANMEFVNNSIYQRPAEINVRLEERPASVYLAIQADGMSANGYNWSATAARVLEEHPHDEQIKAAVDALRPLLGPNAKPVPDLAASVAAALKGSSWDVVRLLVPSFRVHVYYPTGQTFSKNGRTCSVYTFAPSFGYFGVTAQAEGWRSILEGAYRVAENLYALPIPRLGRARIRPKLQGLHKGEVPLPRQPIRKVRIPRRLEAEPLRGVVERIDLISRVIDRVSGRFSVLEETERRISRLRGRLASSEFGEVRAVFDGLVQRLGGTRQRMSPILAHLRKSCEALEHRISILDRFLDTLYAIPEADLEAVVAKAFPGQEGIFSTIIELEQQAYALAAVAPPVLENKEEGIRALEAALTGIDERVAVLKRIDLDLDRRPLLDHDLDIREVLRSPLEKLKEPKKPSIARLGALGAIKRSLPHLDGIGELLGEADQRVTQIHQSSQDLTALQAELAAVNETKVLRIAARLRRFD